MSLKKLEYLKKIDGFCYDSITHLIFPMNKKKSQKYINHKNLWKLKTKYGDDEKNDTLLILILTKTTSLESMSNVKSL
jgi:hypothetical protein